MKASELMIGDWVIIADPEYKEGDYYQVIEVLTDGIKTEMFNDIYEDEFTSPIPLTEDILKANKFELHEHELILRRRTSYDEYYHVDFFVTSDYVFVLDIECSDKDAKVTRVHKIINYVHQLQRALYLCGLTDLADNFKIK